MINCPFDYSITRLPDYSIYAVTRLPETGITWSWSHAAPLIAAVVKTTGIVKRETIEPMIANQAAFRAAWDQLQVMPVSGNRVTA